jgi:hypothetical protein
VRRICQQRECFLVAIGSWQFCQHFDGVHMARFVPVTKECHFQKKWPRPVGYEFAAVRSCVPIVAAELAMAALAMPLAFSENNGPYVLVAVMSTATNCNAFVGPGGR